MKIQDLITKYKSVEINILLAYVLKKSREFLFLNPNFELTKKQYNSLVALVKRREKGEPVAYILGYKDFCGLRFKVNKNVLVPRPETEELVDHVVDSVREQGLGFKTKKINILDVGTGSGCIAVSIYKKLNTHPRNSGYEIYGSDVSSKALEIAKKNSQQHKTRIKFVHSNLLAKINFSPDIIVANLPYGWKQWKNNTSTATLGLKFEPHIALYTKDRGLFEIHRLLKQISNLPSLPQRFFLEFDPRQKQFLSVLIKKTLPKFKTKFYKDLSGRWRFVEIIQ